MSNGIRIHNPILCYWVMEFEFITHYFFNEMEFGSITHYFFDE